MQTQNTNPKYKPRMQTQNANPKYKPKIQTQNTNNQKGGGKGEPRFPL